MNHARCDQCSHILTNNYRGPTCAIQFERAELVDSPVVHEFIVCAGPVKDAYGNIINHPRCEDANEHGACVLFTVAGRWKRLKTWFGLGTYE